MKRFIGLGVAAVAGIALTALFSVVGGSPTGVQAAGTGGTISFGAVSTNTVPVNTTTTTDTYSGFNVSVATNVSPGVTLTNITASAVGSIVSQTGDPSDISDLFCSSGTFASGTRNFGCTGTAGQAITTAGLLTTLTFVATGDGCVQASLRSGNVDQNLNTYTINFDDSSAQATIVGSGVANILIGTGVIGDCGSAAATPTATATETPPPLATATPTPTRTPCAGLCPTPSPTLTPGLQIKGTLTPTGTPATSTPAAGATQAPPAPGGSTPPASGTGAGAGAPRSGIRLPDTGSGPATNDVWSLIIASLAAAALGMSLLGLARRKSH